MNVIPNAFILGGPKCGTTSLSTWLAQHKQVCFSEEKEPNYFNDDDEGRAVFAWQDYLRNFKGASEAHRAIAEATVWYLSSKNAVPNILEANKEARFIAMVRNPVQMAQSLHRQLCFTGVETEKDFQSAWNLQESRKKGENLPALYFDRRRFQYGDICRLGAQVQRLLSNARRDHVKIIVFDEFCSSPRAAFRSVQEFLGLDIDDSIELTRENAAKRPTYALLTQLILRLRKLKPLLRVKGKYRIAERLARFNSSSCQSEILDVEFARHLKEYFSDDVKTLGRILGMDLSSRWLSSYG